MRSNAQTVAETEPSDAQRIIDALMAMHDRIVTLEERCARLVNRVSYLEGSHQP